MVTVSDEALQHAHGKGNDNMMALCCGACELETALARLSAREVSHDVMHYVEDQLDKWPALKMTNRDVFESDTSEYHRQRDHHEFNAVLQTILGKLLRPGQLLCPSAIHGEDANVEQVMQTTTNKKKKSNKRKRT